MAMGRTTKKKPCDYITMAEARGFEWVGKYPGRTLRNTTWKCKKCNYLWKTTYAMLQQGRDCPGCTGRKRKTKADYTEIGKMRGFTWVGKEKPSNTKTNTDWLCSCGWVWNAPYNNISHGSGCPRCSNHLPLTEENYRSFGERNIEWIGKTIPKNTGAKTTWRCLVCGNEWMQCYGNIGFGTGCPACVNIINGRQSSKAQNAIAAHVGGIVNYKHKNWHIDVALPGRKIAIEYDSWFWHFDKIQEDYERAMKLAGDGWRVLAIKAGKRDFPTKEEVIGWIKRLDGKNYVEIIRDGWGKGETKCVLNCGE